jgi:small subunit ribosomal protein S18
VGKRLYVGNLAYSVSEAELRDLFAEFGDVAEVKVVLDRDTGRPRGFAFVEMGTDGDAAQAMSSLNGRELQGRSLNIKEAQERSPGGRGGGGGGGGMDDEKRGGGRGFGRKKVCRFCADKAAQVDFKDQATLKYFVTERGKIIPRRISGNCATHQRAIATAIKRSRGLALIPYHVVMG